MKNLIFVLLTGLIGISSHAQDKNCGTEITKEQIDKVRKLLNNSLNGGRLFNEFYTINIPVKVHIITKSDGTGGLSESSLNNAMTKLNSFYANSGISFFLEGAINYINNSDYYDFNSNQESEVCSPNDLSNVVNVYFFNSIVSGGSSLCGYTYLPPSADRILMVNGCTTSGNTLAHEFGHYFTLFHTHGKTNNGTTDELVDGSNCVTSGDDICDTPADPNLSGNVNGQCQYTGSFKDANGDLYTPMVNNVMSYAPGNCRNAFTSGQYDRIRNGFFAGRDYLNFIVDDFKAAFTSLERFICIDEGIQFIDKSSGANNWEWIFPGGSPEKSFSQNPIVFYEKSGAYDVKLITRGGNGAIDSTERKKFVVVDDPRTRSISTQFLEQVNSFVFDSTWLINNPDQTNTFQIDSADVNANSNSGSIAMLNFIYSAEVLPQSDWLMSQPFNLDGLSKLDIEFKTAYAYKKILDLIITDSLNIYYQLDCQEEWVKIAAFGGDDLSLVGNVEGYFVPNHNEWKTVNFSVDNGFESQLGVIRIAFENISYNGNNLYLDDIKISPDYSIAAPNDLTISKIENNVATLRWIDNSVNEKGFIIQRSFEDSGFVTIDSLDIDSQVFRDSTLTIQGQYSYQVLGFGNNGILSEPSNIASIDFIITGFQDANARFNIYPIPTCNTLNFEIIGKNIQRVDMYLYDVNGKHLVTLKNPTNHNKLNMSMYPSGLYYISVIFNGEKHVFKVIKH